MVLISIIRLTSQKWRRSVIMSVNFASKTCKNRALRYKNSDILNHIQLFINKLYLKQKKEDMNHIFFFQIFIRFNFYSTVTDFAKFRGMSTSLFLFTAI